MTSMLLCGGTLAIVLKLAFLSWALIAGLRAPNPVSIVAAPSLFAISAGLWWAAFPGPAVLIPLIFDAVALALVSRATSRAREGTTQHEQLSLAVSGFLGNFMVDLALGVLMLIGMGLIAREAF